MYVHSGPSGVPKSVQVRVGPSNLGEKVALKADKLERFASDKESLVEAVFRSSADPALRKDDLFISLLKELVKTQLSTAKVSIKTFDKAVLALAEEADQEGDCFKQGDVVRLQNVVIRLQDAFEEENGEWLRFLEEKLGS